MTMTQRFLFGLSCVSTAMSVGCHPTLTPDAPARPELTRSALDADALLMPSGSPYGRAINGVSFQQEALLTYQGSQYATWYTREGNTVMIARRSVEGDLPGPWQLVRLDGSTLVNGGPPGPSAGWRAWNSHNVVVLGICPADGTIHLFYDMHAGRLRYRVSVPGLADGTVPWDAEAFRPEQSWLESDEKPVPSMTYPRLASAPDGSLVLLYRVGGSGNGDLVLRRYRHGSWSSATVVVGRSGSYTDRFGTSSGRNAYENGLSIGADGGLHLSWTWRERDPVANQGIGYAFSHDEGVTWRAANGTVVADTSKGEAITVQTHHVWINTMDRTIGTVNQQAQMLDHEGRPHVVMFHRRDDSVYQEGQGLWPSGVQSYFHYVLDPRTRGWQRNQLPGDVGSRPKLGVDPGGRAYLVYQQGGKLIVQRATPAEGYRDWNIHWTDIGPYTGELLLDPARLREQGILSILAQRDGPVSSEPIGTMLEVIELDVRQK